MIDLNQWYDLVLPYKSLPIEDLFSVEELKTKLKQEELAQEVVLEWFKLFNACWIHNADPKKPHAELTSGMCSNGFFDCLRLLKYVNVSEVLAVQLAIKIRKKIGDKKIDWVIGSPMAGITFAYELARALSAKVSMFVEKDVDNPGKMLWKRMQVPQDVTVLQVEELITTAKTLNAVQEAVDQSNRTKVDWVPIIAALVHRPVKLPHACYGEREVVALLEQEVWAVKPEDCPLCKQGSLRFRPKTHWKKLTE